MVQSVGRKYNPAWSQKWDFLDYDATRDSLTCSDCKLAKAAGLQLQRSANNVVSSLFWASSWTDTGFSSWNKASERIAMHSQSASHLQTRAYVARLEEENTILHQVTAAHSVAQRENRVALVMILQTVVFLARQCLAFRGHDEEEGNFRQLLQLRSGDSPVLAGYLAKDSKTKWLSPEIQNNMISAIGSSVLGQVVDTIVRNGYFSIIMDETTDVSRVEQVSLVLRTISADLTLSELFVGLYDTTTTEAEHLLDLLVSTLQRISNGRISLEMCRGQTYDGASNMRGHLSGLQTRVRAIQPRALFSYCSGHMLNLVLKDTAEVLPMFANSIEFCSAIGNFCRESAKRTDRLISTPIESDILVDLSGEFIGLKNQVRLKFLCPTRWVMRRSSIDSLVTNYLRVLTFLDEMASGPKQDPDARMRGKAMSLLLKAESFQNYFGLRCLQELFAVAHPVHKAIQSRTMIVTKCSALIGALENQLHIDSEPDGDRASAFYEEVLDSSIELRICEPELKSSRAARLAASKTVSGVMTRTERAAEIIKERHMNQRATLYSNACDSIGARYDREAHSKVSAAECVITRSEGFTDQLDVVCEYWGTDIISHFVLSANVVNFHEYVAWHPEQAHVESAQTVEGVHWILSGRAAGRELFPALSKLVQLVLIVPASSCEA